jgi:Mce-associated membrane protein
VEDQPADSSDLTAAEAASVPQGKAARSRHRLPRQKAHQVEQADEAAADVGTPDDGPEAVEATDEPKDEPKEGSTDESTPAEAVVEPTLEAEAEAEPESEPETEAEEPEVVLVAHRPAGRALKIAAVAAGVLFIAAAAFAGATIQPYLTDRAAVHTKFLIAETAASAITTLWTYTPDDMDKLPERSAKYLGGDFATEYKRYIDAIVAPNKQAQVTNNTQVLGAAVESLTPTEATAIVYTNSVATSPVTKGIPSLRYLSYRLTMKPQGSHWLITQMVAVTKLDLTPRL